MERYEIYLNGSFAEVVELEGIAYLKFESACLLGDAALVRVVDNDDPVLGGRFKYNPDEGGWDYDGPVGPPCPPEKKRCSYKMPYESLSPQRNALRVEIMSPADRCGWNLKPGRMGGRPDDYLPCRRPSYV